MLFSFLLLRSSCPWLRLFSSVLHGADVGHDISIIVMHFKSSSRSNDNVVLDLGR
jgi:hypothetical protein